MDSSLTPSQRSAISRATRQPALRRILFSKASGVRWFAAFEQAGFLDPTEIPPPIPAKEAGYVSIPPWPITEYLLNTSPEFQLEENVIYASKTLAFIRSATTHARSRGFGNYRAWWQFAKIIRNIPVTLVDLADVSHVEYWLDDLYERGIIAETLGEKWLSVLLGANTTHSKAIGLAVFELLFRVEIAGQKIDPSIRKKAALRFNTWHARKILAKSAEQVGSTLGLPAVRFLQGRLEYVLTDLERDAWSSIWRAAVEDHDQNQSADDAEDILVEGFRDTLLAYVGANPKESQTYVEELLVGKFDTTKRIAIYAVDRQFEQLRSLLTHVLGSHNFKSNLRHELWHMLDNHYAEFSKPEKQKSLDVIEGLEQRGEDGKRIESATAYARLVWLAAIERHDDTAAKIYENYLRIAGGAPEHPDFASYMTGGWVRQESPIAKDELLSMPVDDLIERLDAYPPAVDGVDPRGSEGLAKTLRQVIKTDPGRFVTKLTSFVRLDPMYVYEVIEAYSELWREKAPLPWETLWAHVLDFCEAIVLEERFWTPVPVQQQNTFRANRFWIVGAIGSLIDLGTRSGERPIPETLLPQAEQILIVLLSHEKGETFTLTVDAVSVSINSPRGRCVEALIAVAYRACVVAEERQVDRRETWGRFQPSFDGELNRYRIHEYEFSTLLVNHLAYFLYMSKDWISNNLGQIFSREDYQHWLCAMQGYAYVNNVHESIYIYLRDNGHFIWALDDENLRENVKDKVIQNIVVAYFADFDSPLNGDGLLTQLLSRNRYSELSHVIWFIWTQRHDKSESVREKVLALWSRIAAAIDRQSAEGKKLASSLCDWISFIDTLDDRTSQLVYDVLPYCAEGYRSFDLLENIARIGERQPEAAYEIWVRVLDVAVPDFPPEALKAALQNIMRTGADGIRRAKDIASRYVVRGNDQANSYVQELIAADN